MSFEDHVRQTDWVPTRTQLEFIRAYDKAAENDEALYFFAGSRGGKTTLLRHLEDYWRNRVTSRVDT